jgi:hypothetical protein
VTCSCSFFFFLEDFWLSCLDERQRYEASISRLFFFISATLFRCEWASDNNNMNNQLHQICFSLIHSLLFLSLLLSFSFYIVHSNLYFTSYSDSKSIHIYILTNDALTQKVIFLLCPIHLTLVADVWFVHFQCSSTCSNIHMRIIVNEKKKFKMRHTLFKFYQDIERVIVARSCNKISRSPLLSLSFHCLFRTLSLFHWRHTPYPHTHTHTSEM